MFGNSGPLINKLEQRFRPPAPDPFIPSATTTEPQPRPDVVSNMFPQAGEPPTVAKAIATITGALLRSAADDETAKTLYSDWDALADKLRNHFKLQRDAHQAELRRKDQELTAQGRALVEKINTLQREASGLRNNFNAAEEIRSQFQLKVQALGPDPMRKNDPTYDPDEFFLTGEEIEQWRAHVAEGRAKLETQQSKVDRLRNQVVAKENEIEAASRQLTKIKQERKAVRSELRGEFVSGPNGLRSWKVPEL
jgi:DNA repair exonuclease SbcCD ATPase subunit